MEITDFEKQLPSLEFTFTEGGPGPITQTINVSHDGTRFIVVTDKNTCAVLPATTTFQDERTGKQNDPFESHTLWMDDPHNVVDYILLSSRSLKGLSVRLLTPPEDWGNRSSAHRLRDWSITPDETLIKKAISLFTHVRVVSYGRLPPKKE